MAEKDKKPEIRFTGFTDAWELRKLGELCDEFQSGKNIKSEDIRGEGRYPVFGGNGLRGYTNTYNHDGLYALIGRQGALCGNMNISYGKAYFTEHAVAVKGNKNNETRFLFYLLGGMNLGQYSGQSAQPGLAVNKLIELSAFIPTFVEQAQISALFKKLDILINLHRRKYDKLVIVKKSMLEKMFPKDGANVPEIRFAGFTDAWELRKLGDITFPSGVKNSGNIPYESYSISNEKGFVPQNEQFEHGGTMRGADKSMYYIVSPQSFAYNPARINVGSIGYQNLSKSVIVSSLYEVFKTTNECDDGFLWYWIKTDYFQKLIERYQEGGVRLYFYYDKFCKGTIRLPSVDEQHKIGVYFNHLDTLITLHQHELEKLKSIKKIMLEKMFV